MTVTLGALAVFRARAVGAGSVTPANTGLMGTVGSACVISTEGNAASGVGEAVSMTGTARGARVGAANSVGGACVNELGCAAVGGD